MYPDGLQTPQATMYRSVATWFITWLVSSFCVHTLWLRSPDGDPKRRHRRWPCVFVATIASVQLIDAVLCYSLGNGQTVVNLFVSRFVLPSALICEPLVAYYGAVRWAGWSSRPYHVVLLAYTGFLWGLWISSCVRNSVPVPPEGFLDWCQMGDTFFSPTFKWSFAMFLFVPFLVAYPRGPIRWAMLLGIVLTFCVNYGHPAFGARWCWTANGVSLLLPSLAMWEDHRSKHLAL